MSRWLRKIREEKGISIREIARRLNLSAAYLSDVELEHRSISNENLMRIAAILEVNVDDLRKRNPNHGWECRNCGISQDAAEFKGEHWCYVGKYKKRIFQAP